MNVFEYRSVIQAPALAVFSWHERPEALTDLLPSTRWVRIDHRVGGIRNGEVTLSVGIGTLRLRWVAKHDGFVPGRQFCDEQVTGPFAHWRHRHRFIPIARELTVYEDRVEYALPGGRLINRCLEPLLRRLLTRAFKDRHAVVRNAVSRPQPRASRAAAQSNGGSLSSIREFVNRQFI